MESLQFVLDILTDLYLLQLENIRELRRSNDDFETEDDTRRINDEINQKLQRYRQSMSRKSYPQIRMQLTSMITTLTFDPPSELSTRIETLLQQELETVGIKNLQDVAIGSGKVCLWKGDITTLKVEVVVNSAKEQFLGCFTPSHRCIDNSIHTRAGPRLREECRKLMSLQTPDIEPMGQAKLTRGYALPAPWIVHTVGPFIDAEKMIQSEKDTLACCYRSCLELCKTMGFRTIAFPYLVTSTGPQDYFATSEVALATVKEWLQDESNSNSIDQIILTSSSQQESNAYKELFSAYFS